MKKLIVLLIIILALLFSGCDNDVKPGNSQWGLEQAGHWKIPVIISFTATTPVVHDICTMDYQPYSHTTLSWDVTDADEVEITQSLESVCRGKGTELVGSQIVAIRYTTTYFLIATNGFGSSIAEVTVVMP